MSAVSDRRLSLGRVALALLLSLTVAGTSYGDSYSKVTTVKGLTVGGNMVRIVLDDLTGNYEQCATETWYAFNLTDAGAKEMYATLLAAKASGQRVFLQSVGCTGAYSKVTMVYACETLWCQ